MNGRTYPPRPPRSCCSSSTTTPTGPAGASAGSWATSTHRAQGVAAGKTPEGGIVGSDTQGNAGYGGHLSPAWEGHTVEFVLYALSKKIPLTPGFQPAIAEAEYGGGKLLLGQAAVTYGVASR